MPATKTEKKDFGAKLSDAILAKKMGDTASAKDPEIKPDWRSLTRHGSGGALKKDRNLFQAASEYSGKEQDAYKANAMLRPKFMGEQAKAIREGMAMHREAMNKKKEK